jgi:hypothetical protein
MDINYEEKELGMSPPFKFVEEGFLSKLLVSITILLILIRE